ncbi:FAD binding domain-containing protein [Rhodococcus sp. NPDC079359]|uniref:FAD binding domain-containing protein n=1 Tax=Rhodococcus sp. NPDC079359 TaxID=3154961 RepID=UPI00344B69E5
MSKQHSDLLTHPIVSTPHTLDEAIEHVAVQGYTPLAGGTWLMRSPIRGEAFPDRLADLSHIPELRSVGRDSEGNIRIGAMVTHTALADALPVDRYLDGLRSAARKSANPNIRNTATVGGNLATQDFRAPDVATALLALRATVVYAADRGEQRTAAIEDFVANPPTRPYLITAIVIPRSIGRGVHVRLPLRVAGDYPVVIVSIVVHTHSARPTEVTIAYGAVGPRPSRWRALEERLVDHPAELDRARVSAHELSAHIDATASVGVPAEYRKGVLPVIFGRAFELSMDTPGGETE